MTLTVSERPILFSGPMVRAILEGRKTQTRRVVRERDVEPDGLMLKACPYGEPGDTLWVRETWAAVHCCVDHESGLVDDIFESESIPQSDEHGWWSVLYSATDPDTGAHKDDRGFAWRPSIHMPRWASRLTLRVTGVRVERLQEISEEDARAEGMEPRRAGQDERGPLKTYRTGFVYGWDTINGKRAPWASNPWVWVVSFERVG